MKKILAAAIIILVLLIISIYVFIPKEIAVSQVVFVKTTDSWVFNFLSEGNWAKWWPKETGGGNTETSTKENSFNYGDQSFSIDTLFYNAAKVKIRTNGKDVGSKINIIALKPDSIGVFWECHLYSGLNPFQKLAHYRRAVRIKESMVAVLSHLKSFLDNPDNIYGMHIEFGRIQDTLLLATKATFNSFPQTAEIYDLFRKLDTHMRSNGAVLDGSPMLNINKESDNIYTTMVALPINKTVPETNEFRIKRMVPGNTLVADVKGGPQTIEKAFVIMDRFKLDHERIAPAKHFQSIITDRTKEADTSKWITRLYYPIR